MYHLQQEPGEISHHLFNLFIATPEKVIFDQNVFGLNAPGKEGFFEVLVGHAAFMAILKTGKLVVTDINKQKLAWEVSGGIFEIYHNKATVLVDSVVPLEITEKD